MFGELFGSNEKPFGDYFGEITDEQIRRIARILFIDDEGSPKADSLRTQGYNVFDWGDVEKLDEIRATGFHIIFCDVKGVGGKLSDNQGAGLIRMIKEQLRFPAVIGYSAYSYSPGTQEWEALNKAADDVIQKDADVQTYINLIRSVGKDVFSPDHCAETVANLSGVEKNKVNTEIIRSIKEGDDLRDGFQLNNEEIEIFRGIIDVLRLLYAQGII